MRLVRQRNQGGGRKKPEHLKIVTINSHSHFGQTLHCVISTEDPLYLLLHHEELCDDEEEPGYVAHHEDHHDAGQNPPLYKIKPCSIARKHFKSLPTESSTMRQQITHAKFDSCFPIFPTRRCVFLKVVYNQYCPVQIRFNLGHFLPYQAPQMIG